MHLPPPSKKGLYEDEDVDEGAGHGGHVGDSIGRGFAPGPLVLAHDPNSGPVAR